MKTKTKMQICEVCDTPMTTQECKVCRAVKVAKDRFEKMHGKPSPSRYRELDMKMFRDEEIESQRRNAILRTAYLVRTGKVKKKEACEHCGAKPKRLIANQNGNTDPYDFLTLCYKCHRLEGVRRNREKK